MTDRSTTTTAASLPEEFREHVREAIASLSE